jgi:hypothetical protein
VAGGGGFSLIEVNVAVLLVAIGMLSLFALFPAALREADSAVTDTHTALFADHVLSGLEANAFGMTNWSVWKKLSAPPNPTFQSMAIAGVRPNGVDEVFAQTPPASIITGPYSFVGNDLKYILEIGEPNPAKRQWRSASLWVWSGTYSVAAVTDFKLRAEFFHTEFYYPGVMP